MWITSELCGLYQQIPNLIKYFILCIVSPMSVTYQPKKKKRSGTHGFLVRSASSTGKKVLQARRRKGRSKLSV